MRSGAVSAFLALLVITLTLPAHAAVEIQEITSDKGVTAWFVEDHSHPIVTVEFSFKSGATQDPDGKEGLANLMSGLFDEGAGNLGSDAFQKRLDEIGAEMSFDVGQDGITGEMRMLSQNSDEALELLRLALTSPRFDADPLERIRGQVAVQIRAAERSPREKGREELVRAIYGDHPYTRPVEGTLESLSSITQEDLKAFHKRVFARSNLTVGVVGDIHTDRLRNVLDDVFGGLPAEAELMQVEDVTPRLGQELHIDYPLPQTTLSLVYPGISRDDPQFFAAYLMNHILGGGTFSSYLFQEVREKRGLAYNVSSYLAQREHSQTLMIHTSTSAARANEALALIEETVKRMREEGPSEEELAAAKTYVIGAYAINHLDSSTAIARTLVGLQEDGLGTDYMERRADIINAVTLEDVHEAARRLLTEKPALLVIGPKQETGG